MKKLHIKKGDMVIVNAGEDKGKTGKVLQVLVQKDRAIVEGVNMAKRVMLLSSTTSVMTVHVRLQLSLLSRICRTSV